MTNLQPRAHVSPSDSEVGLNIEKPTKRVCYTGSAGRHRGAAGGYPGPLQDPDRRICLLSQEMGAAQLAIITQTFCAVEETPSDSEKLLVSCCERSVSGVPKNGQEGKGWLSPWKSLFNENTRSRAPTTL